MQLRGIEHVCQGAARVAIWGAGHGGLLLFNEHSDRSSPHVCLSVTARAVCAQPSVPPCLTSLPAGAEPRGGGGCLTGLFQIQASGASDGFPLTADASAVRKKQARNVWEVY